MIPKLDQNWSEHDSLNQKKKEKKLAAKVKKGAPLLLLVLLSISAIVVGAGIYQYFTTQFMHRDTIYFDVSGMDAQLTSSFSSDYMAHTELIADSETGKAFVEAPLGIGGPMTEVRDMVIAWAATNIETAEMTVTVSGLPEGLDVDIRYMWYTCFSESDPDWYGALLMNDGVYSQWYYPTMGPAYVSYINWEVEGIPIVNGVPFILTSVELGNMKWLDQPNEQAATAVPNGMIIHISTIDVGEYQGPHTDWGTLSEDVDLTISVEISGTEQ